MAGNGQSQPDFADNLALMALRIKQWMFRIRDENPFYSSARDFLLHINLDSKDRRTHETVNALASGSLNPIDQFDYIYKLCTAECKQNGAELYRQKLNYSIKQVYSLYEVLYDTVKHGHTQSLGNIHNKYCVIVSELAIAYLKQYSGDNIQFALAISLFEKCLSGWLSRNCSFTLFENTNCTYDTGYTIFFILNYIFENAPSLLPIASPNKSVRRFYNKIVMNWLGTEFNGWLGTEFELSSGTTLNGCCRNIHNSLSIIVGIRCKYLLCNKDELNMKQIDRISYEIIKLLLVVHDKTDCDLCPNPHTCDIMVRVGICCSLLKLLMKGNKYKKKSMDLLRRKVTIRTLQEIFDDTTNESSFAVTLNNMYPIPPIKNEKINKALLNIINWQNIYLLNNLHRATECDNCHAKRNKLKKCAGCLQTFYCSKSCQKRAWKQRHAVRCVQLRIFLKL